MNTFFPDNSDSNWQSALPECIEEIAFNLSDFPAVYHRLKYDVALNLEADADRHSTYLGTYFPRTFMESYNLHRTLLSLEPVRNAWKGKPHVNVFDFGCGTGGNLAGLLLAMRANQLDVPVRVWSLDGNGEALSIQKRVVSSMTDVTEIPMDHRQILQVMPTASDAFAEQLAETFPNPPEGFDLVMAWKSLSELYMKQGDSGGGQYRAFIRTAASRLTKSGVISLLDLTFKSHGRWLPMVLSSEIKTVLQERQDLDYLMPFGCAQAGRECELKTCYTRFTHSVGHSLRLRDTAKFTFFALCRPELREKILPALSPDLTCPRSVQQLPFFLQQILTEMKEEKREEDSSPLLYG